GPGSLPGPVPRRIGRSTVNVRYSPRVRTVPLLSERVGPPERMEIPMDLEALKVRKEGAVLFVDIAAPPMNLLGPALVRDLVSLIQQAQADSTVRVLVFKSADPEYFIAHVDVTRIGEYREATAKLTGEASLGLVFRYLSASPLITIAQV